MNYSSITIQKELKERLQQHVGEGETYEDVIIKLLDFDDEYGDSKPIEFEVVFDDRIIKVFRVNGSQVEYFTPARKFSISLSDWNLESEFTEDWIRFITSPKIVGVLMGLGENTLEYNNLMIHQKDELQLSNITDWLLYGE